MCARTYVLFLFLFLFLGACPCEVSADDYRARETLAMLKSDQCGPEVLTTHVPASLGDSLSGAFKPACQRHDACYNLKEKTQKWCDDQFATDLRSVCDTEPFGFKQVCLLRASLMEDLVRSKLGGNAYKVVPSGVIHALRSRVIKAPIGADELEVCVDVHNDSKATQEYKVILFDAKGVQVDREPDEYEVNVQAGHVVKDICVSTENDWRWDAGNVGRRVFVQIMADPAGYDFMDDMVAVDVRAVDLPKR